MKNKVQTKISLKTWWQETISQELKNEDTFTQLTDEEVVQDLLKLKWRMKKAEAEQLLTKERRVRLTKNIMEAISAEPEACDMIEFKLPDYKIK